MSAANCQSRKQEGEVEISRHFRNYCAAFARLRLKPRYGHTHGEPAELAGLILVASTYL